MGGVSPLWGSKEDDDPEGAEFLADFGSLDRQASGIKPVQLDQNMEKDGNYTLLQGGDRSMMEQQITNLELDLKILRQKYDEEKAINEELQQRLGTEPDETSSKYKR